MTAEELIAKLQLSPHPEGGYYREVYRSPGVIPQTALPGPFGGDRNYCTSIFFLLPQGARSHLHRIAADEIWHFYLGGPLKLVEITPDGTLRTTILGQAIESNQVLQHVVPAGHWFGAYPLGQFALVGCTVSPGFDFADFELADRRRMLAAFPQAREEIERLTAS